MKGANIVSSIIIREMSKNNITQIKVQVFSEPIDPNIFDRNMEYMQIKCPRCPQYYFLSYPIIKDDNESHEFGLLVSKTWSNEHVRKVHQEVVL